MDLLLEVPWSLLLENTSLTVLLNLVAKPSKTTMSQLVTMALTASLSTRLRPRLCAVSRKLT
jgi:hypothetical protein